MYTATEDPMKPEDLTALVASLEKVMHRNVQSSRTRLQNAVQHARDLQDVNSAFPETKWFLEARGLTNIRQLDATGKAALLAHLHAVFQSVGD